MKLKYLTTAILLSALPASAVFAAALDRSGQSIAGFLQPNNYFEAGISVLDPDVSGKIKSDYVPGGAAAPLAPLYQGTSVGEMGEDYFFPSAVLKYQINDHYSFGLIYDQPFGADAEYPTDVARPAAAGGQGIFHNGVEGTQVEVKSQNLTLLFGYQPNENFNFYAGPAYQTVEGSVRLRGIGYGSTTGFGNYNASIAEEDGYGWVAGMAYQIPDIALKASITYRSEIEHDADTNESGSAAILGLLGDPAVFNVNGNTNITTPQSVNLDLQTGIMANTVAFANIRWVNWKDFSIRPTQFDRIGRTLGQAGATPLNPQGFDIVSYSEDQWNATVGVGRKFSEQWAGNVSVGWDSGAGNPITTLGPTDGYYNVGLGLQYSPEANYFIAGGVKYFWLGDAKAQTGAQSGSSEYIADFNDNTALGYGLKIGYKF